MGREAVNLRQFNSVLRQVFLLPVVALLVVVLVALPFFSLRLGSSDHGNDPVGTTTRQAYDFLASGFGPGFNGPLLLVTQSPGQADAQALDQLAAAVRAQPGVDRVVAPQSLPAMTFSLPTNRARRSIRWATSSGCSM